MNLADALSPVPVPRRLDRIVVVPVPGRVACSWHLGRGNEESVLRCDYLSGCYWIR
jgi:hypothetical protein